MHRNRGAKICIVPVRNTMYYVSKKIWPKVETGELCSGKENQMEAGKEI